jgi:staphylococcal nuclease domain-containing protein 1
MFQPFAWASRDYLRKKAIGKTVTYTVEYKNPNNNKEYGVVHLVTANGEENLVASVVSNGWAKVKRPNNPPKEGGFRPYDNFSLPKKTNYFSELQELITLEEDAQRAEKGIWNKDPVDLESAKRPNIDTNPATVYDQYKGKSLTGIFLSITIEINSF